MLFYVSAKSNDCGFIGSCVVSAEDNDAACKAALALLLQRGHTCNVELLGLQIPPSNLPLPPRGRLLSHEELEEHYRAHGGLAEIKSEDVVTDKSDNRMAKDAYLKTKAAAENK